MSNDTRGKTAINAPVVPANGNLWLSLGFALQEPRTVCSGERSFSNAADSVETIKQLMKYQRGGKGFGMIRHAGVADRKEGPKHVRYILNETPAPGFAIAALALPRGEVLRFGALIAAICL